ncbi:hypothetical protein DPMN_112348 [Dreissena polymorpha]|uniref:Uncharacterized protein n=1 Tax=Dreissena polymorpha TaxID=45954 RepID=A0A9D4KGX0_DREPO|nr:hypothetical protein DPMN_112348 [Dreissena polymorpha]
MLDLSRDLYKQKDSILNEPKNKLTLCYAKRKRDLRPNETSRDDANFQSRHFDRETVTKRSSQIKITNQPSDANKEVFIAKVC